MLKWPSPIYVSTVAVDMRRGHDGLAAMAREHVGREPLDGALFVFFNRRVDRLKALWWDRTGYCLLYKRLERGTFRVPQPLRVCDTSVVIDSAELDLILEGVRPLTKKQRLRR